MTVLFVLCSGIPTCGSGSRRWRSRAALRRNTGGRTRRWAHSTVLLEHGPPMIVPNDSMHCAHFGGLPGNRRALVWQLTCVPYVQKLQTRLLI